MWLLLLRSLDMIDCILGPESPPFLVTFERYFGKRFPPTDSLGDD